MEEDRLVHVLTDYLDGKLSPDEVQEVEKELATNEHARKILAQVKEMMTAIDSSPEEEPSHELRLRFDAYLASAMEKQKDTKIVFFESIYFKVAAAVLMLVVAGSVGYFISEQRSNHLLAEKSDQAQTIMLAKLDDQYSVSERLIGINEVYQSVPNKDLMRALINLMNEDTNTNVRLAAVNALLNFYEEPLVRKALIKALSTQTDPLVQIELIQLLVEKHEQEAVTPLENIISEEQTLQAVKDEAYAGLLRLS